ncbi:hypothetical protein [Bradyrhizobium archetypum]|uniref:Uncharacterized protein n=1 Tax=Bradyrhizobium archetypum TaxID=2721160 RepID=A0A7Y4M186_9BRAD|nr:hypothetical protein [Bradyrhizobium archetypum]NOJ46487.1 hypothetical protein [Bradyrhizobium archetypum]
MKRTGLMLIAAALAGAASSIPAHAVPPTVTPSPGYEARLREQRASRAVVAPVVKSRRIKRRAH